jgi:cytochrome c-type biogenesis protein CcsB
MIGSPEMLRYEALLHWCATGLYSISAVLFTYCVSFQREKAVKPALLFSLIGFLFHSVTLGLRWLNTGHPPYTQKYEIFSTSVWISVFLFTLIGWKQPKLRTIGVIVMPLGLLIMGVALMSSPVMKNLSPALKGVWFHVHAATNGLTAGSIILAVGASVLYVLKEKRGTSEFYRKLPSGEVLDEYAYKFASFGFIFWGITIVSGAIWAHEAWGRYWAWDPIETWSLITWLVFGLYLHLRHFYKWRGKKAAFMLIMCFIMSVLSLLILPFVVDSIHTQYFR